MGCLKVKLIAIVAVLLISTGISAKEFSYQYKKIVETSGPVELDLRLIEGKVTIEGGFTDEVVIEAVKWVDAVGMDDASLIAEHILIDVAEAGNRVNINTTYLRMVDKNPTLWDKIIGAGGPDASGRVDYKISVPSGSHVTVTNVTGAMTVSAVDGDVSLFSSSADVAITSVEGAIRVENGVGKIAVAQTTGTLSIFSTQADIDLNTVEGKITVQNGDGRLRGEMLFGPLTVRQPRGKIDLLYVDGDIRLKSQSAEVSIQQESGSLDVATVTGAVTIKTNLDSVQDYFVETQSGRINFSVPEYASGKVDIESDMGSVQTDVPISVTSYSRRGISGEFGRGGAKISLQSTSGDVSLAQF